MSVIEQTMSLSEINDFLRSTLRKSPKEFDGYLVGFWITDLVHTGSLDKKLDNLRLQVAVIKARVNLYQVTLG